VTTANREATVKRKQRTKKKRGFPPLNFMNNNFPCKEAHGILPGGADYPGQLFQAHASGSTTPGSCFPGISLSSVQLLE